MIYIFSIRLRITIGIYVELVIVVYSCGTAIGQNQRDLGIEVSVTVTSNHFLSYLWKNCIDLDVNGIRRASLCIFFYKFYYYSIQVSRLPNLVFFFMANGISFFSRISVSLHQSIRIHLMWLKQRSNEWMIDYILGWRQQSIDAYQIDSRKWRENFHFI